MKKFDHSKKTFFEACWPEESITSAKDIIRVFRKTDDDNVYRFASYTITVIGRVLGINDFYKDNTPISKICEEVETYVSRTIDINLLKQMVPYICTSKLLLFNATLPNESDKPVAFLLLQNGKLDHDNDNVKEICFGSNDTDTIVKKIEEDPAMVLSYILGVDPIKYGGVPFVGEMFGYILQSLTSRRSILVELLYIFLKNFDNDSIMSLIKMLHDFDAQLEQQYMEDKDSALLQ